MAAKQKIQMSEKRLFIGLLLVVLLVLQGWWFFKARQPKVVLKPGQQDKTLQVKHFESYQAVLDSAPELTIFSLTPDSSDKSGNFHRYPIVGQAKVKGADKDLLLMAIKQGIADPDGQHVMCFDPHHGLRGTANGQTVDLVICFMCTQFGVFPPKNINAAWTIGKAPEKLMNKFLKRAGAKFDPSYTAP
jgi:hypothetical protein